MVRKMLDERKAAILRAVVEEYIATAQPVGSARVARSADVECSPATIRNDMVALEREGYLIQPHTSAGRVPTELGYRFFVDSLGGPGPLGPVQQHQVRVFFSRAHGEIEKMLAETSKLVSDLTEQTAVVVGGSHESAAVRSVQLVPMSSSVVLAVAVLSDGAVEKRYIEWGELGELGERGERGERGELGELGERGERGELGERGERGELGELGGEGVDLSEERVAAAGAKLSACLVGHQLGRVVATPPPSGDTVVDVLVKRVSDALKSSAKDDSEQLFVGGAARVASAFDASQKTRAVLELLEHQLVIVTLLRDVLDRGLSVAIGSETGLAPLAECSVVVAPYEIEGERAGTVGVLGPTRMNYAGAMAAVAAVSRRLGRQLGQR